MVNAFKNPPADAWGLKENRIIEETPEGGCVMYWRSKMPMMSDREAVLHMCESEKDEGTFLSIQSVQHPSEPAKKGIVRMYYYFAVLMKQEGDNIKFTDIIQLDFKGYMPSALMNMSMASETAKGFTSIMK